MRLDVNVLQSFALGRVFKNQGEDPTARVNSISFHRTEDFLVSASDDDTIRLYNTQTGMENKTLLSKKYGCANISFTHDAYSVIASSNKGNDYALRYHDLHANRFLRYFRGHTGRVTTLSMSPKSDVFLSAAEDKTVRLWDLRVNGCQALLQAPGLPTTAFDEQGLVFAVGAERGVVKLYDARNWAMGPFVSFPVSDEIHSGALFGCLKFSLDGSLLLAVAEGRIYLLDSFEGTVKQKIVNPGVGEGGQALEACLTPDSKFVLSGSPDCSIRTWSVETGAEVARWTGHAGVPACLKFSPRKMLVASACSALGFWIPDISRLQQLQQQQQQMPPPLQYAKLQPDQMPMQQQQQHAPPQQLMPPHAQQQGQLQLPMQQQQPQPPMQLQQPQPPYQQQQPPMQPFQGPPMQQPPPYQQQQPPMQAPMQQYQRPPMQQPPPMQPFQGPPMQQQLPSPMPWQQQQAPPPQQPPMGYRQGPPAPRPPPPPHHPQQRPRGW